MATGNTVDAQCLDIQLWPGDAPGTAGMPNEEYSQMGGLEARPIRLIYAVTQPTLTVYLPEASQRTGAAVIVCPGGGYSLLAIDIEGHAVARELAARGLLAAVLKYRMTRWDVHGTTGEPWPLADAHRALRTLRQAAPGWGVDPARIGILGFSAGGHLAAWAGRYTDAGDAHATDPVEQVSNRPDFVATVYPAFTIQAEEMGQPFAFQGGPPAVLATPDLPPIFVAAFRDDQGWYPSALAFEEAATAQGTPLTCHYFDQGGHGFGLGEPGTAAATWPDRCMDWLRGLGMIG
ncbi:MAG TPA: alpha/beta hydrolase [Armatimonadota bacterium]|jgi:acetyl esterase/lipase